MNVVFVNTCVLPRERERARKRDREYLIHSKYKKSLLFSSKKIVQACAFMRHKVIADCFLFCSERTCLLCKSKKKKYDIASRGKKTRLLMPGMDIGARRTYRRTIDLFKSNYLY